MKNIFLPSDLIRRINSFSSVFKYDNDYVNEFFLRSTFGSKDYINDTLSLHYCYSNTQMKKILRIVFIFLALSLLPIIILASILISIYFLITQRYELGITNSKFSKIAIIRYGPTFSKLNFLKRDGVIFYTDSIKYQHPEIKFSIYSQPLSVRLTGVLHITFYAIRDYLYLIDMLFRMFDNQKSFNYFMYIFPRIPAKVSYEYYLLNIICRLSPTTLYTGSKEDRYAMVDSRLTFANNTKLICIPHGMEYSIKMPMGLPGDVFYCYSEVSEKYFKKIYTYCEDKFVYDSKILSSMLSCGIKPSKTKRVVFFPQLREFNTNIYIMTELNKLDLNYFIKLHPNDSIDKYENLFNDLKIINSYGDAISNNVCLSCASTVLLEAIYNNSDSIALLVNDSNITKFDSYYPALHDASILRAYSFHDLSTILKNIMDPI